MGSNRRCFNASDNSSNHIGARGTLAMVADGWLTKLDTGLKWGDSRAMMLRCEVARIVRGAELAMAEKGRPIFRALMPDGELRDVAVR